MRLRTMTGLILAAALAAGCASAKPTATSAPATDPPGTEWTDISTPDQPTLAPTDPGQLNYEPTAAAAGSAPYSGYACTFAADQCSCETAVVIKAAFTFNPGDKMTYEFHGDTYGAAWEMTRLAANQWSYTIPIGADETGSNSAQAGHYFTVLTFTHDGFTLLQSEDKGDGTQLTCPAVSYKRLTAAP